MKFDVVAKFDVVIIGSGISGLICALELAKAKKSVCILTKEAVTESASLYAQGGIAISLSEGDGFETHLEDTIKAGGGLCNIGVAREIINNSSCAFNKLIDYGVKFDLDSQNKIHLTKESAHSKGRVCHVGGDASGRFITKALIDKACREPHISISQGTTVLKVLKDNGGVFGVLAQDVTKNAYVILAKDVIIATGGIGQIYSLTSNPLICTGDGIVMAYRLGAVLQDVEMVQFHPTVLFSDVEPLLITEAIRGEGGRLKNINGEFFACNYHSLCELAPRDVLARAILNEMKKTKSKCVYLDLSNFTTEYFKNRFPNIYEACLERKIDLFDKGIPVAPGAHYFIGGIQTNIAGRTNIDSLWAVGEAACNGFHGANRLASNSLLECVVVPLFLSQSLLSRNSVPFKQLISLEIELDYKNYEEKEIECLRNELREKSTFNLGLIRNEDNLVKHLNWLSRIQEKLNVELLSLNPQVQELKNMIVLSFLICLAALNRKNSLGVHFREDFKSLPNVLEHSILKDKGRFSFESGRNKPEYAPLLS